MCGAGEIYCRQSDCIQPVGWYIIEPCDAFTIANSAATQAFDSVIGSLNWNASTCGCSIPRVLRRQRCSYRTCNECAWIAMKSTFTATQQWAEGAKEHPASWAQRDGDYLLFRRTKMRLKNDYEHTQRKKGKQRATDLHKNSFNTNSRQNDTTSVLPIAAETAGLLQWPSLDMLGGGHLNTNSPDSYRVSEAAHGDTWDGGVRDNFMSAQGLQASTMLDFNQEAPNIASEFGATLPFDYPPNVFPQNIHEPPQPISTSQEFWDKGVDFSQLFQPRTEALPQISNVQHTEFDFNDPFWTDVFGLSGNSALDSHPNTYQAKDS